MSATEISPTSRMSAQQRRELVLEAATRAFGRTGYAGTSTDVIAKEAGVSQPYVVRIFGTKLDLFLEVFDHATAQIIEAFREVLGVQPFDREREDDWQRLGASYTELLLSDRGVLQVMMHGFAAGEDERIGELARRRMGEIFNVIRSTGCSDDEARDFVAHGMLLNVLTSMNALDHIADDAPLAALSQCAFGDALVQDSPPR